MSSQDWFTVSQSDRMLQIQFQGTYATAVYYFVTEPQSLFRRLLARVGVIGRGNAVFVGGEWAATETEEEDDMMSDEAGTSAPPADGDATPSYLGPSSGGTGQTPQQSASVDERYQSLAEESTPRIIDRPPESVLSELDRRGYTYQGVASVSVESPAECLSVCSLSDVFECPPDQLVDSTERDPDLLQQTVVWEPPSVSSSPTE